MISFLAGRRHLAADARADSGCLASDSAAACGPAGRQARRPAEPAASVWGPAVWRRSV